MTDPQNRESERLSPAPPVAEAGGVRERSFRNLATIDLGPLRRRREFRLLFFGQGFSFLGSMVTFVAVPYQAYDLTGSSLVVGLIAAAELPPILITAFLGGALADAFDRRRLVQIAELGLASGAALLLVNSLLGEPRLWVLFLAGIAMAAFDGIQRPPLDALEPRLVERDELPAASALGSLRGNVGMIAGPALGGVLIATIGLPATYAFDLVTFAFSLGMLSMMRAVPPPPGAERPSIRRIKEGIRYSLSRQELIGTYSVDFVAMFFGMPMALFPAYAAEFGGPGVLGLLYAAPAVGSLAVALTSGWTAHVHRHGLAVILAAGMWGVAMIGFGLAQSLAVAVIALGRRRRRRLDQRHFPLRDLEPDDPGRAARAPGRDRADQLLERANAREPRGRRRRGAHERAHVDPLGRDPLRRRRRDRGGGATRLPQVRLPRARHPLGQTSVSGLRSRRVSFAQSVEIRYCGSDASGPRRRWNSARSIPSTGETPKSSASLASVCTA